MTPPDEVKLLPELKPCPFCDHPPVFGGNAEMFTVCCEDQNCAVNPSVDTYGIGYREDAVRFWNSRATPPPPEPSDEAVRAAIKDLREAFDWLVDNGDDHRSLPDAHAAFGTIFEASETLIQAATRPAPAPSQDTLNENQLERRHKAFDVVIKYLLGEENLDGYAFGQERKGVGPYWWRAHLRRLYGIVKNNPIKTPSPALNAEVVEKLAGIAKIMELQAKLCEERQNKGVLDAVPIIRELKLHAFSIKKALQLLEAAGGK